MKLRLIQTAKSNHHKNRPLPGDNRIFFMPYLLLLSPGNHELGVVDIPEISTFSGKVLAFF
jgi:hypothetical protein